MFGWIIRWVLGMATAGFWNFDEKVEKRNV